MTLPTPSIEYFLLCPMLIVFSVAIVGVLVEAFLPRRIRYVAQVTLSLLLLIGAGLFVKSLSNLRALGPGFPAERPRARSWSTSPGSRQGFHRALLVLEDPEDLHQAGDVEDLLDLRIRADEVDRAAVLAHALESADEHA